MRRAFVGLVAILSCGCGDRGGDGDAATVSAARFWIVGTTASESVLLRSDDGAATWIAVLRRPIGSVSNVTFVDRDHGWAAGGEILRTVDGGAIWKTQVYEPASDHPFLVSDIAFAGPERGIAVGAIVDTFPHGRASHLIETSDGGVTWRAASVASSAASGFSAGCVGTGGSAFAVGGGGFNSVSSHVRAARRTAAGAWDDVREVLDLAGAGSMNGALRDVACVGTSDVWVVGRRVNYVQLPVEPLSILRSRDGGASFNDESTRSPVRGKARLEAVDFVAHHGWAVGSEDEARDDADTTRPLVLRTIDDGGRWHRVSFPDDRVAELTAVDFATSDDGLVLGADADGRRAAYVSDDGGQRWLPIALPEEITGISDVRVVR